MAAAELRLVSALSGPGQLGFSADIGGWLVLAVAPGAARAGLVVLPTAASADHVVIVTDGVDGNRGGAWRGPGFAPGLGPRQKR